MSLFKARRWWATTCEGPHDLGCLCTANIDNSAQGYDKVIVSSLQGVVRIYQPRPPEFCPDHVIIEKQLAPVLQLGVGKFVQGSSELQLATLHPRELCVHTLTSTETADGLVYTLTPAYRHTLAHTACNMTWGSFGGAKEVELICVQSMDGELLFVQQEAVAFSSQLPCFLLPGPLCYCARTDTILTVSSSHTLSAFRYHSLAVASSSDSTQQQQRSPMADWSASLGEAALEVQVECGQPSLLLVLGERSVFCFNDSGVLRFMKKLDSSPSCCHAYGILPSSELQWLVASHSGALRVFRDAALVWAASLESPAADISIGRFKELEGVVVSVDEQGHLACSYLGTDPTLFSAPSQQTHRRLDYTELDREMAALQSAITEAQREGGSPEVKLVMRAAVASAARLVQLEEAGELFTAPCKSLDIKVVLSCSGGGGVGVGDVTVNVAAAPPLSTHPSHLHIEHVLGQSSAHVFTVVCSPSCLPTSTSLELSATYTAAGVPGVLSCDVELPLTLFCEPAPPSKSASCKITIDTNHPCQPLRTLFADCAVEGAPDNAMGFAMLAGAEVTVVSSRSSSRYRLQSDNLAALAVFLQQLVSRLSQQLAGQEPPFEASYLNALPLNDYFDLLEKHFGLRLSLRRCRELLSQHAQQFRAVQKRLLTRFKDKTPVGLAHLDTLLDGTYMQLMVLGEKQAALQSELEVCSCELSCASSLLATLLRLAVAMKDEDFAVLQSVLSVSVPARGNSSGQGWEEQTDTAITHLLRTSLARSARDTTAGSMGGMEVLPEDCSKIKRHIALLCDRIIKGGSLTTAKEATRSLSESSSSSSVQSSNEQRAGQRQTASHHVKHKPSLPSLPEHATD